MQIQQPKEVLFLINTIVVILMDAPPGNLTGGDIIKFENTEWISTMSKTFGSKNYVKDMIVLNRSTKNLLRIGKTSFENQTSATY